MPNVYQSISIYFNTSSKNFKQIHIMNLDFFWACVQNPKYMLM